MSLEFRYTGWDSYTMDYHNPHVAVEPLEDEIACVNEALQALCNAGIIPHIEYDKAAFLAHRQAVAENFEIPWTAITPRMQRLLYAINAIRKPDSMIAAGVFCGNTFISNAGAGVGPGAIYQAENLIGLEIKPEEAERAERNVRKIDPTGVARILAEDAVPYVENWSNTIDLLYLDADGDRGQGKGIYLEILEGALDKLTPGAIIIAHNSINCAHMLQDYFTFVRDTANFPASMNVFIDGEGIEVTVSR